MDKITIVTLLVCLTMGIAGAAAPRSSVDNPIYNFGEVLEGFLVIHTFTLSNVGDETLTISRVRTSCGCTTTTLSNTSLAPGESVGLEAVFDTRGYGGRVFKSIFVESNDPDTPRLTLRLTGIVKEPEPYHIAVGDLNYLFYLLIDLRDPEAYAAGHLMGAINAPLAELEDWTAQLPRGVLTILYDQDGSQSDQAALMLRNAGSYEVWGLQGGLDQWQLAFQEKFMIASELPAEEQFILVPESAGPITPSSLPRSPFSVWNLNSMFYLLIDLRNPKDFAVGHLMGAINVPYAQLEASSIWFPHETPVILCDQDGSLSDEAAQTLNDAGFPDVKSLLGGLGEWMRVFHEKFLLSSVGE